VLNTFQLNTQTFNGPSILEFPAIDFESSLVEAMLGCEALAEIVGEDVWPLVIPEHVTIPAITYTLKQKPRLMTLDGPAGIADATVQIVGQSFTYQDTRNIQRILRGLFTPSPAQIPMLLGPTIVLESMLTNETHEYVDPPEESEEELGTFNCVLEFRFRYRE
jgi:hypothetical protein